MARVVNLNPMLIDDVEGHIGLEAVSTVEMLLRMFRLGVWHATLVREAHA